MTVIAVAYLVAGLTAGVAAMVRTGFWTGAAILAATLLSLAVVSGVTALFRYDTEQRVAMLLLTVVTAAAVAWLSQKFEIAFAGVHLAGWQWCMLGAGIGALRVVIDRDDRWSG